MQLDPCSSHCQVQHLDLDNQQRNIGATTQFRAGLAGLSVIQRPPSKGPCSVGAVLQTALQGQP